MKLKALGVQDVNIVTGRGSEVVMPMGQELRGLVGSESPFEGDSKIAAEDGRINVIDKPESLLLSLS